MKKVVLMKMTKMVMMMMKMVIMVVVVVDVRMLEKVLMVVLTKNKAHTKLMMMGGHPTSLGGQMTGLVRALTWRPLQSTTLACQKTRQASTFLLAVCRPLPSDPLPSPG